MQIFHHTKENGKNLNKTILQFVSHNSEKVKLAYKSNYNKRKSQVILPMVNDEANN